MALQSPPERPGARVVVLAEPAAPMWVEELLGAAAREIPPKTRGSVRVGARVGSAFSLTTVRFAGVEGMDLSAFQQSVSDAFDAILERIGAEHALRFWAFIPGIHAGYGNGLDRYMVFNAGRFAAFSRWLGGGSAFDRSLPTASAVGLPAACFALHCLASRRPGAPVENPRQIPAYHYSRRFGPRPPCFARATLLRREADEPDLLLVGGTASIAGEDSRHPGELTPQMAETLRNLASVVLSAGQGPEPVPVETDEGMAKCLSFFRELRVYFREPGHLPEILAMLEASFPNVERIEALRAELCRPELLLEIEGVAPLPPRSC